MPTQTKTPAEIPAENVAAHHTAYEPLLSLDAIHPHARNPRHNAVADTELVESIRDQGLIHDLVVAPHPSNEGEYILIDGHRRYDALTRNGYTYAPSKIRLDLVDEGDQLAAMLATIRREDLSPVEEAEGFEDLFTVHGWSVERISAATGRSKTLITERRKLTRLPQVAKTAADSGQITIDDALRIAKLPPAEQTALEKMVSRADFRYEIQRVEGRVKASKDAEAAAKKLRAAGVPEVTVPKSVTTEWSLNHADHGVVRLPPTGFPNESDHVGCLAFIIGGTKQYPALWLVCSDPGKHDQQLSEVQKERKAAEAAEEAERAQRREAHEEERRAGAIARQMRCDALLAALKPKTLDPTLDFLIRFGLADLISEALPGYTDLFHDMLDTPADQRWTSAWNEASFTDWSTDLQTATGPALAKVLAAYLATRIESLIDRLAQGAIDPESADITAAAAYFDALAAAGHELNTVDKDLRDRALNHTTQEDQ
ncbi:ParB/RepB/Spo0J family partition protein [Nocardioides sp.]|uniref:ParB/RepB/Spo0J family partition protein n=1 Tax=Nocardioides sp. TaxID=35761 RepID=UPI002BD35246|nr:ParB/RepB/Spo0J family partition protein [Nocardioides sp.]HXH77287.1 ParB/RepB/Spo0J family partition protein [Nocardioides sp.]